MAELIFVILTVLYSLVSAKVDEWITISTLGFLGQTPVMFLERPRLYYVVRSALFIVAVAVSFATTFARWYICLAILAGVWLGAGCVGRRKAFNTYRRILREMMEQADSPEQRAEYEAASKRNDQELLQRVQMHRGYRCR